MHPPSDWPLVSLALGSIALLVLLVTRWKLNPFLSLTLASLLMGGGSVLLGITPVSRAAGDTSTWTFLQVVDTFQLGLGKTLG